MGYPENEQFPVDLGDAGGTQAAEPQTITGWMQASASRPYPGTSLVYLMDPADIASVRGLPQHVYDYAADFGRRYMGGSNGFGSSTSQPSNPSSASPSDGAGRESG